MSRGFTDDYFEHYCFFERGNTPYLNSRFRYMGNGKVPYDMFDIYKEMFHRNPRTYVDLGCGTGDEMLFYRKKGCSVLGCDFSDYVLKNKNEEVAKYIKDEDSLSFINSVRKGVDVFWENTLQYLDTDDFNALMLQIQNKASDKCLLGVLYDETDREHPYRKQLHSVRWWKSTMRSYGFVQTEELIKACDKHSEYCRLFVFVKEGSNA